MDSLFLCKLLPLLDLGIQYVGLTSSLVKGNLLRDACFVKLTWIMIRYLILLSWFASSILRTYSCFLVQTVWFLLIIGYWFGGGGLSDFFDSSLNSFLLLTLMFFLILRMCLRLNVENDKEKEEILILPNLQHSKEFDVFLLHSHPFSLYVFLFTCESLNVTQTNAKGIFLLILFLAYYQPTIKSLDNSISRILWFIVMILEFSLLTDLSERRSWAAFLQSTAIVWHLIGFIELFPIWFDLEGKKKKERGTPWDRSLLNRLLRFGAKTFQYPSSSLSSSFYTKGKNQEESYVFTEETKNEEKRRKPTSY